MTEAMTSPVLPVSWNDSTPTQTSVTTTLSLEIRDAAKWWDKASIRLEIFCPPLILLPGLFGNVMILVTMRRMTSHDSVFHIHFQTTAVFDIITLVFGSLVDWLKYAWYVNIEITHVVFCKVFYWLFTGGGTISVWCVVSMTVHRALSVVWQHRVNALCTRRTVLLVLTGIVLFFALLYSHYLIGFKIIHGYCIFNPNEENYILYEKYIFRHINTIVHVILPFTAIVASNIVLVWKLRVSVKAASNTLSHNDSSQVQSREKSASSVTHMVIAVSLTFIMLTLPLNIINYLGESGHIDILKLFLYSLTWHLQLCNHAVNFYLYVLTGTKFKEEVLEVLCSQRKRGERGLDHGRVVI